MNHSRSLKNRRGSALILALIVTISLAGLVTSAIYLGGNATILATSASRERDFKYASEAALAIGKSRLNTDPSAVPDTGYTTLLNNAPIPGADGIPVSGVTVNMYAGPTSSTTGQFGRFVSVVTEARDARGARFVRRLELTQESFAKFAYWSDKESDGSQIIYFSADDELWGPVWSNDVIYIASGGGATFHNDVGTAKTINGVANGTFHKGYSENQRPITLPTNNSLSHLSTYATSGNLNFTAPNSGTTSQAMMRIEFVAIDLNGDGKTTGIDEGFFRVYKSTTNAQWLRADWNGGTLSQMDYNCGAFYNIGSPAASRFVPVGEHDKDWFRSELDRTGHPLRSELPVFPGGLIGDILRALNPFNDQKRRVILSQSSARCFLGGDPHLLASNLSTSAYNAAKTGTSANIANNLGGTPTTFTASGGRGAWVQWTGTIDARLNSRPDRQYLFPLYRGLNTGTKGVIYVNGTVGLSGTVRSRVTLYASGNIVMLDDLRYATDPSTGACSDILGVISGNNIMVADNAIQGPQNPDAGYRDYGSNKDVYIHGVLMALNTSFGAENYSSGSSSSSTCETRSVGRGCLYLTGGLIQNTRAPVGTFTSSSGTGYVKRYSYDRCALYNPPPYFPTTGRYTDNRYYELDPVNFDVAALYRGLTPSP